MGSFDFLASHWKDLAKIGELAEQYLYSEKRWNRAQKRLWKGKYISVVEPME